MRHSSDNCWNSVREVFADTRCHACGRALRAILIGAFATGLFYAGFRSLPLLGGRKEVSS